MQREKLKKYDNKISQKEIAKLLENAACREHEVCNYDIVQ